MGSLVPDGCSAPVTSVRYDIASPGVGVCLYRTKDAAAGVCTVTGIDVNVQGAQAKWTVVAGGISEALDLFSAAGADKSAVVFCESLDFRSDRSFRLGILPDFNIFIVLYHTFFPKSLLF